MLRLLEDTTPAGADRRASGSGRPIRVLKFGGSVLRSGHDLQRVAGEIYRQTRDGAAVIAVVSAFEGETDELLQLCETAGGGDRTGVPDIVSLGEEKTARLLRLACLRIGIRAMLLEPEVLAIRTEGDALAGRPVGLSDDIAAVARSHGVVIVPGYVGLDWEGRRTLLGRGGTDFSAIFIAGETGAALRLYKDVDGEVLGRAARGLRRRAERDSSLANDRLRISRAHPAESGSFPDRFRSRARSAGSMGFGRARALRGACRLCSGR